MFEKLKAYFRKHEIKRDVRLEKQYTPNALDIENFIKRWNIENPVDRYYRIKHNIRFNSPEHRALSLIDITVELYEDSLFQIKEREAYEPGKGEFLKVQKVELPTDEELMKTFIQQDLSQFDDIPT